MFDSPFIGCYNVCKPKRKKSTQSLSLHRESRMVGSRQGYLAEWASEGVAERHSRVCEPEHDLRYQLERIICALKVGAISAKQGGTAGYSPVPAKKYLLGRAFLFLPNKRENGIICHKA